MTNSKPLTVFVHPSGGVVTSDSSSVSMTYALCEDEEVHVFSVCYSADAPEPEYALPKSGCGETFERRIFLADKPKTGMCRPCKMAYQHWRAGGCLEWSEP